MRGWLAGSLLVLFGISGMASVGGAWSPPPGDTGDTGDTAEPIDSGDSAEPVDTADSAEPVDSGDSGIAIDTADGPRYSAAQDAGEKGGFGCSALGMSGSAAALWGGLLVIAARRRRED